MNCTQGFSRILFIHPPFELNALSSSSQFKSISFNSAHSFAFVSLLDIQALRLHRYQRSYAHKTTMLEGINLLLCSMVVLSFSMQSQSKRIENDE